MKIKQVLTGVILCLTSYSMAQTSSSDSTLTINYISTPEEFANVQLPPLKTLFENARTNPRLEAIQASFEAAKYDSKLAKRDWWNFFALRAGYTYGILGTYSDYETEHNPLTTTYSGATQSSWSIGANINVPLDQVINHRLRVKKQQKITENARYTHEVVFNEIKGEIIELYTSIVYRLKMLNAAVESITLYKSDYNIAKSKFINNQISTTELSALKDSQRKAEEEYNMVVSQLNMLLLKLEIITNTKLISK